MQQFTFANQALPFLRQLYCRKNVADLNRFGDVLGNFFKIFNRNSAFVASSPARVELVGNHLDHNGGKVLACTVDRDILAAFCPNDSNIIRIAGKNRGTIRVDVSDEDVCTNSTGLVKGVVRFLKENGFAVGGFDAYTDSTIPSGVGMSSSAAFELAVGSVISCLFNGGSIPHDVLARAGQFAENVYFAKPCGLLDQSVIAEGGVVHLDFCNGTHCTPIAGNLDGLALTLISTGTSHSRLSELYAAIPADMCAVAQIWGKSRLADVDADKFFADYFHVVQAVGERAALRAKHFFEETQRVSRMTDLLQQPASPQSTQEMISVINASGDSSLLQLQNCSAHPGDSVIEDIMKFARSVCPCGARVHGGGFAGTVLCVVPAARQAQFLQAAEAKYGAEKVFPLALRPLGAVVL